MKQNQLQTQRFEFKYQIRETTALRIRDFLAAYLDLDEFGASRPDLSYPVHSLYFDSDDYYLYQTTINGDKNRYKLRLRFYEDRPDAPVFFEVKRRVNNTICKSRGGVKRHAVDQVVAGQLPALEDLANRDPRQVLALQDFIRLAQSINASPKTHVAYLREAWLSRFDNSVRVTMDRNVRSARETTTRLSAEMQNPVHSFEGFVILELKFTNRFPNWFLDLVRVFGLHQTGAAKYVDGLSLINENLHRPLLMAY